MNGLAPDPLADPLAERLGRLSPDRLAQLVRGLQERIDGLRARVAGPIAVVGMALRVPGAASPDALWDLLCRGEIAIGPVPEDRWGAAALSRYGVPPFGGFIDGVDRFDATFFRISPAEAATMDPQQRLVAEVAWEALESAGYALAERRPPATGVFLGMSTDDYKARFLAGEAAATDPRMATGTANSVAAGRLSYLFDLTGPALQPAFRRVRHGPRRRRRAADRARADGCLLEARHAERARALRHLHGSRRRLCAG
jgi:hypothetical protein